MVRLLSSTNEVHDLDLIALLQGASAVLLAGDDLAVQLDRDASLVEAELIDHIRDGLPWIDRLCLAVDDHAHAQTILISAYLYNVGAFW